MKRDVLIIGNAFDKHLERFIRGLKKQGISQTVDIFDISMQYKDIPNSTLYDNVYRVTRHCSDFLYFIPILSKVVKYYDLRKSFKEIGSHYAIINIQVVTIQSYLLLDCFLKVCKHIITTPWGSDVYRISDSTQKKYQKVYDASDYVCVLPGTKFGDDVIDIFKVAKEKCIELCFGSDILDRVMTDNTAKDVAKKQLFGSNNCYVITCGYNASPAQNHFEIVDTLSKIKNELPDNSLLVFPVTYAQKEDYLEELDRRLKETGINYLMLTSYLTDEEMVWLRKGTDLFIHMQKTDAYSSSLHEYLYANTKVINAEWLSYKELEKWGMPYKQSTFSTLPNDIIETIAKEETFINEKLRELLKVYSWSYQIMKWKTTFNKLVK